MPKPLTRLEQYAAAQGIFRAAGVDATKMRSIYVCNMLEELENLTNSVGTDKALEVLALIANAGIPVKAIAKASANV